jgi:hypothetical protein
VWNEAPIPYGSVIRKKERYVIGVVTPASPCLIHGAVNMHGTLDFASARPVFGVQSFSRGYSLTMVDTDLQQCTVVEGLTEEVLIARLEVGS